MIAVNSKTPLLALVALLLLAPTAQSTEREIRIAAWNIANLHHEPNIPLRDRAIPRDLEDYGRLKAFVKELDVHVFALQEIGSPAAAARVFSPDEFHLVMSDRYQTGKEFQPAHERDIFTAFAIRKDRFPEEPVVNSLMGLSISNIEISRGKPLNRETRAGLIFSFSYAGKKISMLNIHLKSSCHSGSLQPVFDTRRDGSENNSRFDCRTLAAQGMLLENWIEQQDSVGNSVIVLGDFNRRLNQFDAKPDKAEHFWRELNDSNPNDLKLFKGPLGQNTTCWQHHDRYFYEEHIDFIVFDNSLTENIDVSEISKIGLPFEADAKYAGKNGQRLSDHCPVVGVLN